MRRHLDTLDRSLERVAMLLFGPQPLGYRPAPGLWAKLVALVLLAAVVAFGIVASWERLRADDGAARRTAHPRR
jgi:hypothetical protein